MAAREQPTPTPEMEIIDAGIIEVELLLKKLGLKNPRLAQRMLVRIRNKAARREVVRFAGPRVTLETIDALGVAESWLVGSTAQSETAKRK